MAATFTTTWYDELTGARITDDLDAHEASPEHRCDECGEPVRIDQTDLLGHGPVRAVCPSCPHTWSEEWTENGRRWRQLT